MMTVPEAAKKIGRNPETIRRWIRSGKLRSEKVGTQHVIDESELDRLIEDDDMLPLPEEWKAMLDGRPQPNWIRIVRRSRESH
jgi:excisionase family DNA binding protein